jgi:histidinol-phosphatase (PHP family)
LLPDYHLHTNFSCDADERMDAICRRALEIGLDEIGISDHCDYHPLDECRGFFKPRAWWEAFDRCRQEYRSRLTLRAGLELGEPHLLQNEIRTRLDLDRFDYILGSLHWVHNRLVFDPAYFKRPADVAYKEYFAELLEMVEHGGFDILAHMDIVKRYGFDAYGPFDPGLVEAEIRAVLHELAVANRALEINTGTVRRPVGETSPTHTILRWFRDEGGRYVTFGSDAHHAPDLAAGWEQALMELRSAGFEHYATYQKRQPKLRPLPEPGARL